MRWIGITARVLAAVLMCFTLALANRTSSNCESWWWTANDKMYTLVLYDGRLIRLRTTPQAGYPFYTNPRGHSHNGPVVSPFGWIISSADDFAMVRNFVHCVSEQPNSQRPFAYLGMQVRWYFLGMRSKTISFSTETAEVITTHLCGGRPELWLSCICPCFGASALTASTGVADGWTGNGDAAS